MWKKNCLFKAEGRKTGTFVKTQFSSLFFLQSRANRHESGTDVSHPSPSLPFVSI